MNAKRLSDAGGFLCFLVALALWPRAPLAAISLASFLPHGLFAAQIVRARRAGLLWWWPLAAFLGMLPFASAGWALTLAASLYLLAAALTLVGLTVERDWLASPLWLLRLVARLIFYPALLVALLLSLLSLLFDVSVHLLSWGGMAWGDISLCLAALVPMVFCAELGSRRRLFELAMYGLLTLGIGMALYPGRHLLLFPSALLFLPVMLVAAFRLTLRGVALVSATVMVMLTLFNAGGPAYGALADGVVLLSAVIAGLMMAAVVEIQRRNERSLGEFQARIEALVNNSPNLMAFKGLDGRYAMVNRAYAAHVGKAPIDMIGKRPSELFPVEIATRIRAQDEMVLRCLEPRQFEYDNDLGGGDYFLLETKFPLFDAQGLPAGIGSVVTDISESRKQQQAVLEAEQKYGALIEQSLAGIFIFQDGRLVYLNAKLAEMLGGSTEMLENCRLEDILPSSELARVRDLIRHRFDDNVQVMHYTTRIVRADGSLLDVEVHSRLFDYNGRPASIGFALDISDRIAADANQKLTAKVFETSAEGILICDAELRIIAVNGAFSRITGYLREEALGKVSRVFSDESRGNYAQMMSALNEQGYWRGEMLDRRKSGDWYPAELSLSLVRDPQGEVVNYVGLFADITVRKQAQERMNFLANHDPLTRLPNRSCLISALEDRLLSMKEGEGQLAVIFIDLDRFKLINDSFGHQSGDELLRVIAIRLANTVGERGMLARLGGDEFTLLVSSFDGLGDLSAIAEQVLGVLAKPLRLEEHEVYVTGSIGISVYPNDGADARTLLKNADVAMYRAKDSGKNTHEFFNAEMNAQTVERLVLENSLRQALERDEFELHFQPQVNAVSRELVGVEVLLRWRHPQQGLVAPGRFIPLAEETGLIKPIGAWVLQAACHQLRRWDREGLIIPRVAVNLSARQFEQPNLISLVAGALEESGLAPQRLELEITESMIMQNPVETVRILNELKHLGVQLAIDDFGTGYSSLSILKRFPLDSLKIDRSFVDGLPQDGDSAAITEAVLAMARKLGFAVVAEGVEHEGQANFLQAIGCDSLQGYFFGKPMPAEHFVVWLAAGEATFAP
ncbi:EAL domain-containing protein [Paludibacterium purpuratum]|uniref:EAL domain-containing protein n=1 Tax=Paludibacterium purpuratum TaxID=1144873 RepID=UPI001FB7BD47|nr:EAL domain-containing protein [Paludibacterium purpuratum]